MSALQSILKLGVVAAVVKTLLAYLDPGSGSLIVQILIAIVVGIAATFRLWKTRLLSILGIRREEDIEEGEDNLESRDVDHA